MNFFADKLWYLKIMSAKQMRNPVFTFAIDSHYDTPMVSHTLGKDLGIIFPIILREEEINLVLHSHTRYPTYKILQ
jgi:hypothetical protein